MTSQKIKNILEGLEEMYPDANCELEHNSPYELLIATMLSAQCTDVRVNIVTKELFKKYNTAEKMIELDNKQLEEYIKNISLKGFGGTDFRPVFQYVEEIFDSSQQNEVNGLIYFTDGDGIYPGQMPKYKSVFIINDSCFDKSKMPLWATPLFLDSEDLIR